MCLCFYTVINTFEEHNLFQARLFDRRLVPLGRLSTLVAQIIPTLIGLIGTKHTNIHVFLHGSPTLWTGMCIQTPTFDDYIVVSAGADDTQDIDKGIVGYWNINVCVNDNVSGYFILVLVCSKCLEIIRHAITGENMHSPMYLFQNC